MVPAMYRALPEVDMVTMFELKDALLRIHLQEQLLRRLSGISMYHRVYCIINFSLEPDMR